MADKKQFSNTKSIVKVETGIVTLISYRHYLKIVGNNKLWPDMQNESWNIDLKRFPDPSPPHAPPPPPPPPPHQPQILDPPLIQYRNFQYRVPWCRICSVPRCPGPEMSWYLLTVAFDNKFDQIDEADCMFIFQIKHQYSVWIIARILFNALLRVLNRFSWPRSSHSVT